MGLVVAPVVAWCRTSALAFFAAFSLATRSFSCSASGSADARPRRAQCAGAARHTQGMPVHERTCTTHAHTPYTTPHTMPHTSNALHGLRNGGLLQPRLEDGPRKRRLGSDDLLGGDLHHGACIGTSHDDCLVRGACRCSGGTVATCCVQRVVFVMRMTTKHDE